MRSDTTEKSPKGYAIDSSGDIVFREYGDAQDGDILSFIELPLYGKVDKNKLLLKSQNEIDEMMESIKYHLNKTI